MDNRDALFRAYFHRLLTDSTGINLADDARFNEITDALMRHVEDELAPSLEAIRSGLTEPQAAKEEPRVVEEWITLPGPGGSLKRIKTEDVNIELNEEERNLLDEIEFHLREAVVRGAMLSEKMSGHTWMQIPSKENRGETLAEIRFSKGKPSSI